MAQKKPESSAKDAVEATQPEPQDAEKTEDMAAGEDTAAADAVEPVSDEPAAEQTGGPIAEEADRASAEPAAAPADEAAPASPDIAALEAELARLKSENEALRSAPAASHAGMRTGWAIVLALVAALILGLAVPAVWLNRTVMDTETWVATVAPLAQDPAIQDAVATLGSDRIIEVLDAEQRLVALLPDALDRFAPILASSANEFIRTQAFNIVRSDQFPQIWEDINRTGHKALIAALTGQKSDGAVTYKPGVLTLNVGVLATEVQTRLAEKVPFLSRIPLNSINKQVEIFNSPALAQASVAIAAMNRVAYLLPIVAILFAAGAFALGADRRKVALWLGAAIVVVTILPIQALYLGQIAVVDRLQSLAGIPSPAAQNAYDIIFAGLVSSERVVAVFGLVILVGAVLAGPARWAVAMREGINGGLGEVTDRLELGAFGRWVGAHRQALRALGILVAVLVLLSLPAPRTMAQIGWLTALVIVWVLIVQVLGVDPQRAAAKALAAAKATRPEQEPPAAV